LIERLAIPEFGASPVELEAWRLALEAAAPPVAVRVDHGETSFVLTRLEARGLVSIERGAVDAILFEFDASDPTAAIATIQQVALRLGYELHDEDEDDEDDEESEDGP
jgi:predicted amidohydrolase YtcJ